MALTFDNIAEIQAKAEELIDLILTLVPHDRRIDSALMIVRMAIGSLLAYLRTRVGR